MKPERSYRKSYINRTFTKTGFQFYYKNPQKTPSRNQSTKIETLTLPLQLIK